MKPICLTDDELAAVLAAARPLEFQMRDPFLRAVANALEAPRLLVPALLPAPAPSCSGSSSTRPNSHARPVQESIARVSLPQARSASGNAVWQAASV